MTHKNLYGGYQTEIVGSTQNPKKIIGTPNLPIKTKIFPKKSMFSSLKVKRSRIRMAATRWNLQAQPKMLKKIGGTKSTKNFSTKVCLVLWKSKGAKNSYGGYRTGFTGSNEYNT
jgi:hypothetical protein